MIDIPTVFILGAGASVPYGYPTAANLRASIISNFRNRYQLFLRENKIDEPTINIFLHEVPKFVDAFNKSRVESIDKFLSLNPSFTRYGKIAITLSILHEEKESKLREERGISGASEDWFELLYNRMISKLKQPSDFVKFRENKVAFITFNYDRSFDHFLYESFLNTFSDSFHQFKSSIKEYIPFPIIHVYGQVDKIQWDGGLDYGANYDYLAFERLSDNIRVIGERSNDLKDEIAKIISDHKRIFFLGFGYAEENMDSIGMPGKVNEEWNIYGTAKGMTKNEIDRVRSTFIKNFSDKVAGLINPRIEDKTCYELLREYL